MAFDAFFLILENTGQIIDMGHRKMIKLDWQRLTVKPNKGRQFREV